MASGGRLDLVLINPGGRAQTYQSLGAELAAVEPPVWAGLMGTMARNHGYSVVIVDAYAEELSPEQTATRVSELNPLLAAIVVYGHQPSASTQSMPAAGATATALKEVAPNVPVLMLGGHVAALPERTLTEEATDFVAGGEGPLTLLDLVEALKAGSGSDLSKVRGLWYRQDGKIRNNPPAPLVQNVEGEMPSLAWDLLPMDRYRAHNWHCFGGLQREGYASLYTSLGCPFHCSFCCIQAPFKSGESEIGLKVTTNSYRLWSPEAVMAQIDTVVNKYGVRNIKIADEMFVLHPGHVGGICDQLIERNYGLNIWAYARVDTVREEMIDKLKQAGVNWLAFGIEAANARVRDDVQKGFGQEEIFRTIERVRDAGINVIGNYIFGLPEDDLQTMRQTLDLALDLNCEFGNFYSAMAYPGSALYNHAVAAGLPLPKTWSGYSQHAVDTLPLPTNHLPSSEVIRFRDHAFQEYFNSPRYLAMIESRFGPGTVAGIREMASHTLVRQNA